MIAAPSANKFAHISPTRVEHVISEFKNDKVFILDLQLENKNTYYLGFESTIIKINNTTITLLRKGSLFNIDELEK